MEYINEQQIEKGLNEVYTIGFINGQIEMRNKVMLKLNRDVNFWTKGNGDFMMKLLKKISKTPLSKKLTKIK